MFMFSLTLLQKEPQRKKKKTTDSPKGSKVSESTVNLMNPLIHSKYKHYNLLCQVVSANGFDFIF